MTSYNLGVWWMTVGKRAAVVSSKLSYVLVIFFTCE